MLRRRHVRGSPSAVQEHPQQRQAGAVPCSPRAVPGSRGGRHQGQRSQHLEAGKEDILVFDCRAQLQLVLEVVYGSRYSLLPRLVLYFFGSLNIKSMRKEFQFSEVRHCAVDVIVRASQHAFSDRSQEMMKLHSLQGPRHITLLQGTHFPDRRPPSPPALSRATSHSRIPTFFRAVFCVPAL